MIGVSMEPGLTNGQGILVNRLKYRFFSPQTGDVVVFLPNGNQNAHYYVKRVVAVPGQTVLIQDGILYIDGKAQENEEMDLIAAEDTRNSIKLLNHFEIKTPMTSYHEYNKIEKGHALVDKLLTGMNIALITDAGTPGISDPGEELVKMCYEAGITVTSLPGAAACITALTLSGLSTRRFAFEAFLPTDKKERQAVLGELVDETRTMIVYEAPHRLVRTLRELGEVLGGDRHLTVCRELTKKHETAFRTTFAEAVSYYESNDPKGECVLVIEGKSRESILQEERAKWEEMTVQEHMDYYMNQGIDKKEAMKKVAKDRGVGKRDIYKELL